MVDKREYWGEKFPERMPAAFRDGTVDRIARVQKSGESRTAFIREAVDALIERRERAKAKKE